MASTCSGSGTNTTPETEESVTPPPLVFNSDHKWRLSKKEGSSSRSSSSIKNSSSTHRCVFVTKCARLVKQQRARFYIMRRCVIMLICWHEYNDS